MIEYLAPRGASWSVYTGCLHGPAECPVSAQCWARSLSHRFSRICGGDFKPRFHQDRWPLPRWRSPRRIAVCFMGDLFGGWLEADDPACNSTIGMEEVRGMVVHEVDRYPQHTFLFLTKNPSQLAEYNPWPPNSWVGTTLTGAEPPERQAAMLEALGHVQGAGIRWLSYEPAIKPLAVDLPSWLGWIVIGGWSGKRPLAQWHTGIMDAILSAEARHIPRWEKSNLSSVLKAPLCQVLP